MDVVTSLPQDVLQSILSVWLDLKSFVLLDSALCNARIRDLYISTVQAPSFVIKSLAFYLFAGMFAYKHINALIAWLLMRSIRSSCLAFIPIRSAGEQAYHQLCCTYLHSFGTHIKSVYLVKLNLSDTCVVDWISTCCPNLDQFVARGCTFDDSLERVFAACPFIRKMRLTDMNLKCSLGTDTLCKLPNLRTLAVVDGSGHTGNFVSTIVHAAPNLEHLRIFGVESSSVLNKIKLLPLLKTLAMGFNRHLTDGVFVEIARCCPLISDLNVTACFTVTDTGLQSALSLLTLTSVNLSGMRITDATLHLLAKCQKHALVSVYLEACIFITIDGVSEILKVCTKLRTAQLCLTTIDWNLVCNLTTLAVTEGRPPLEPRCLSARTQLPNLQTLTLNYHSRAFRALVDVVISLGNAPRLHTVEIVG